MARGAPASRPASRPRAPRRLSRSASEQVFARLEAANPDPRGELEAPNAYCLLVAVVLSAQATDVSVNKATRPLFAMVTTPQQMVELGEERLRHAIRTIGLFNTKAKNIIALSRALIERHGGEVPADRAALEALPGVGRKTANVVLQMAFGAETIAVDTHVFRVANRTGLAPGATPGAVEAGLMRIVPARHRGRAHHWLILHGRYTCTARKPQCWRCVIADLCRFPDKTAAPSPAPAAPSAPRKTPAAPDS